MYNRLMAQITPFPTKTEQEQDTNLVDFMGTLLAFHSVETILRAMLAAATEYSDQQVLQEIVDKL